MNNGNVEPYRGFGHIAVMTKDVYAASAELESVGVNFQKRPDEGRMKGLAFALDPDGYWIEIVRRSADSPISQKFTFAQTMFRVKDGKKALQFYEGLLGMTLIHEKHLGVGEDWGFSLFFLAHLTPEEQRRLPADKTSPESSAFIDTLFGPVIELTHNHGTELKPEFK